MTSASAADNSSLKISQNKRTFDIKPASYSDSRSHQSIFCDFAEKHQAKILVKLSLLEAINYAEVRLGKNTNKFNLHSEIEYSQL